MSVNRDDHPIKRVRNRSNLYMGKPTSWVQTNKPSAERRKYTRRNCLMTVECGTEKHMGTEFATNISAGGVHIETRMPMHQYEPMSLIFTIPGTDTVVKVGGKMVWRSKAGVGIKLRDPKLELEAIVQNFSG